MLTLAEHDDSNSSASRQLLYEQYQYQYSPSNQHKLVRLDDESKAKHDDVTTTKASAAKGIKDAKPKAAPQKQMALPKDPEVHILLLMLKHLSPYTLRG